MNDPLADRWSRVLAELRAQGQLRSLSAPAGLDLSSNDYLGYGARFRAAMDRGERSGLASRLLRGNHPIWEEIETRLAHWHGAEAALMMTSGYAANEGLFSTIVQPDDWVASDQLNHASIIDGLRLARAEKFVYRHNDLEHLKSGLEAAHRTQSAGRELFIVTESLFGMEGDLTPLQDVAELAERYRARLIVDEAHATGCFGERGSGLVDAAGLRDRVLATVHTGGKALGVMGGYIVGSALLRELLINRCRHFIFTTALPPAVGLGWNTMLDRVADDQQSRESLHRNAALFRGALDHLGVPAQGEHYIVAVVLGDNARTLKAAASLQQLGYDIRAIRPPSVPSGTARLRISIHADHDPGQLVAVAEAVARVLR